MFARGAIIIYLLSLTAFSAQAQNGGTLEAREINTDDTRGIISASGNVEFSSATSRLTTDSLTYNQNTQQLTIAEEFRLIDKNGDTIIAASGILDNALETGRFGNMRLSTDGSGRLQAKSATRDGAQLALEDAIYTTCPECEKPDGAPLWQVRAARIDYDRDAQNISYAHPRLEVYGVPVFYLPYMAHAGPEIEKRSGFLTPSFASSNDFGTAFDIPYFLNLAPNYDLTLTPRMSEKQDPFIESEWRHLTSKGRYRLTGYMHRPKNDLADDTSRNNRMGLTGDGDFTLGDWKLSFALQEASDDLFFRRYKINNLARLSSNIKSSRTMGRHFFGFEAYKFRETLAAEKDETVHSILPTLTHRYDFATPLLGGNLRVENKLSHRLRKQDVDETRLSSTLDWSWRHITQSGFVLAADNRLTFDSYDFTIEADDPKKADTEAVDKLLSANSTAFTLSYPLERVGTYDRQTVSPKLQLVLADADDGYDSVPYINAATRDLTRSQLFQPLIPKDEASRVNLGIGHELIYANRMTTQFFMGQSYNLSDESFTESSGFGDDKSSLITEAALKSGPLSLNQKARFSDDGGTLLRSQSNVSLDFSKFNLGLSHSFYEKGQTSSANNRNSDLKEATGRLRWQISRHWRLDASARENLETEERVRADAAFTYEDECTLIAIQIDRDYARVGGIKPDTSINFTFTLKTIGN
jgi:LPS-assembly protein